MQVSLSQDKNQAMIKRMRVKNLPTTTKNIKAAWPCSSFASGERACFTRPEALKQLPGEDHREKNLRLSLACEWGTLRPHHRGLQRPQRNEGRALITTRLYRKHIKECRTPTWFSEAGRKDARSNKGQNLLDDS